MLILGTFLPKIFYRYIFTQKIWKKVIFYSKSADFTHFRFHFEHFQLEITWFPVIPGTSIHVTMCPHVSNDLRHLNFFQKIFQFMCPHVSNDLRDINFLSKLFHFIWPCVHMCPLIWNTSIFFRNFFSSCVHMCPMIWDTSTFFSKPILIHVSTCDHVSTCVQWFDTQ